MIDIPSLSDDNSIEVTPDSLFEQIELLRGSLRDQAHVIDRQSDIIRSLDDVLATLDSDDADFERDPVTGRISMSIPALQTLLDAVVAAVERDKMSFRWSGITGDKIGMWGGTVYRGREKVDIADKTITISGGTEANPVYVYVRFPETDISTGEIPDTPKGTRPVPNATYWEAPLVACYYDGTRVVVTKIENEGNLHATGIFGQ